MDVILATHIHTSAGWLKDQTKLTVSESNPDSMNSYANTA